MTEDIKGLIISKKKLLLPILLSVVLSLSTYAVYDERLSFGWVLGVIGVTVVTFAVGEFVNRHHFIGAIGLIALIFACLYFFFMLIAGTDYGFTFQRWLLTGSDEVETRFEYMLAVLISFIPFYAICIYYFTAILYRMVFLTLISIIPCALYVKVLEDMGDIYIALIALLNVAILLVEVRSREDKGRRVIGAKQSVLSVTVFIFFLLAVSAVIPKERDARYYDRFEELFMDTDMQNSFRSDYTNFADLSGNADNYRNFANRRMYTVTGSHAPYFKRQTFDEYDFELNAWRAFPDSNTIICTQQEWYDTHNLQNLSVLQSAMRRADELSPGFAEKYGLTGVTKGIDVNDAIVTLVVSSENFGAMYYLSPARAVDVRNYIGGPDAYVSKSGVFRFKDEPHPNDFAYVVEYYDEIFSKGRFIAEDGSSMDSAACHEMLTEMKDILAEGDARSDETFVKSADVFLSVNDDAMEYKSRCEANTALVPERIKELAEEITDGMTYDWEKANALASYFIQNNYIYDLNTAALDPSVEYFLFESKRGSCSDYASAFTLMARSVGLTVRYCEGFMPELSSRENTYIIKDTDSHAYAEVYIQNIGWLVYESTVASEYNPFADMAETNVNNGPQFELDTGLVSTVLRIMGLVLAVVLIGVFLFPVIDEMKFRREFSKSDPDNAAVLAYSRLSSGKATKIVRGISSKTPFEVTDKLSDKTGTDSTPLAFMVERSVYGGDALNDEDKSQVKSVYEKAVSGIEKYLSDKAKTDRKKFKDKFRKKK